MRVVLSRARRTVLMGGSLAALALSFAGCDNGSSLASNEGSVPPVDSTPQPPPPDTTPTPPPDTTPPPPPPDTTPPPPPVSGDCARVEPSTHVPVHQGIAMGPLHTPRSKFDQYSGNQITAITPLCLMADLDAARRANMRTFISFTGNEQYLRDVSGFSFDKWKQRVDRFRGIDLTPYIEDGTILGHILMDEPNDPNNWNGIRVTQAQIEQMAKYSKDVWPTMTTYIRTFPEFLIGGQYPHLDALWFHYLDRFAPLDGFISEHFTAVRSLGLKIIAGLNVVNGGSSKSGIPGRGPGKYGMSADEIREWGGRLMAEPDICAFVMYEYDEQYMSRPDIKAAIDDLAQKAKNFPTRDCAR
jgi:hypothetical protein